jgi:hypothetical protein
MPSIFSRIQSQVCLNQRQPSPSHLTMKARALTSLQQLRSQAEHDLRQPIAAMSQLGHGRPSSFPEIQRIHVPSALPVSLPGPRAPNDATIPTVAAPEKSALEIENEILRRQGSITFIFVSHAKSHASRQSSRHIQHKPQPPAHLQYAIAMHVVSCRRIAHLVLGKQILHISTRCWLSTIAASKL